MKNHIQTNKATTNIFGLHTQPRKTTRYTNILKLVWGGGKRKKSLKFVSQISNTNAIFLEGGELGKSSWSIKKRSTSSKKNWKSDPSPETILDPHLPIHTFYLCMKLYAVFVGVYKWWELEKNLEPNKKLFVTFAQVKLAAANVVRPMQTHCHPVASFPFHQVAESPSASVGRSTR